jgi:hypothetical protein
VAIGLAPFLGGLPGTAGALLAAAMLAGRPSEPVSQWRAGQALRAE